MSLEHVNQIFQLLCLLRIDIYSFLLQLGTSLISVPLNQLVQDKICLNDLQLSEKICDNLALIDPQYESDKNRILEDATSIKNYQTLIQTAPGIILSLFLGRWMDLYPSHLRFLLTLPCIGGIIQILLLIYQSVYFEMEPSATLYTFISYGLAGGDALASVGAYTYTATKTTAKYRPLRFAVLECFRLAAVPAATALGGKLLSLEPRFHESFRNYVGVFATCGFIKAFAAVWILLLMYDSDGGGPKPRESRDGNLFNDRRSQQTKPSIKSIGTGDSFVSNVLNLRNIYHTMKIFSRKRSDYARAQLWHLTFGMTIVSAGFLGGNAVGFQFVQKAYNWDYKQFSYVAASVQTLPMFGKPLGTYFLVHWLRCTDISLATIGCVSILMGLIIQGGLLTPLGFYLAVISNILAGLAPIGMRSIVTTLIDSNEVAQVYTMISIFGAIAPIASSMFYTAIFNATIDTYPGMVYHCAAMLLFHPLLIVLGVDLIERRCMGKMMKAVRVGYIEAMGSVESIVDINLEASSDFKIDGRNNNHITRKMSETTSF